MPSGDWCSCTPSGGVDLARWNRSHSRRWNHFRTALKQAHPELQFFRGVEPQTRGALHDHAMTWSQTPLSRKDIRAIALRAGFGHSVDLAPITSAKQVAYYVSKYVVKGADQRAAVPWYVASGTDMDTGEVFDVIGDGEYRTWSMSRSWGTTMGQVRAEARAFVGALHAAMEEPALVLLELELGARPIPDESPPAPS